MPLRRLTDAVAIALVLALVTVLWVAFEIVGGVARGIWPLRIRR